MTTAISIVTWNRVSILRRVLDAISDTCLEPTRVLVTDNGSTDGTVELLKARANRGDLECWLLPRNFGVSVARNAHLWLVERETALVRLDDKMLPQAVGWLTSLEAVSAQRHAMLGIPYHGQALPIRAVDPALDFVSWPHDTAGGPIQYVPAALFDLLGAYDELEGVLYGWEDLLYLQRAQLLGWDFGFALHAPVVPLAAASKTVAESSLQTKPRYDARIAEYREAERGLWIDPRATRGYKECQEYRYAGA